VNDAASGAAVWERRPGIVWRVADDGVIVRRTHRRDVDAEARLTGAGAVVWVELAVARAESELARALADAGADDPDGALRSALELLRSAELIEPGAP
jgi:hypothetical protein